MNLRDDPDARRALCNVLMTNYKNLDIGGAQEVLRLLEGQDVQIIADAIDRHLLSTAARFPPKAGDLVEHIRAIENERRQTVSIPATPRGRTATVQMTPELAGYFPGLSEIELLTTNCRDCGDTGMARYYKNWDDEGHPNRTQRVYTAAQALQLPSPMFGHLRVSMAVCDCTVGRSAPCRQARTVHKNVEISTWPTLGEIQMIADKQRQKELGVIL